MGAVLLKHRQDGFWGEGNQCVHGVTLSVRILTDGSGETASTPKIVSDVGPKAAFAIWSGSGWQLILQRPIKR
jgi:hypothetical protein